MTDTSASAAQRRDAARTDERAEITQAGLALALAVLGAGLILSPPITVGLAGGRSWLAYLVHLVAGGTFSLAVGMLGRVRGTVSGLAELAGKPAGPTWRGVGAVQVVTGLYLGGFIAGQAAIALTAGRLLGSGLFTSGPSAAVELIAVVIAIGVVAVAVLVSVAGYSVPGAARKWRVLAAILLGVALCSDPALLRASQMLPAIHGSEFWPAAFLLLFAGVGWERSAVLASSLRSSRSMVRAVVFGWALVSASYLLLCGIAELTIRAGRDVWPTGLSRPFAVATGVVLGSFCVTNVEAAGGFLVKLAPGRLGGSGRLSRSAAVVTVGVAVSLVLACALGAGWQAYQLLAGPAVATLLIYLIALCSGLKPDRRVIVVVVVPLVLLLFIAIAAVWQITG